MTFSIVAVAKSEMSKFLKSYLEQSIDGKTSQKIYDDGSKTVSFTNVNAVEGGYTAGVTTNGKVGPKIDENALKEFAKGKKTGEVQDYARNINGVEDVVVNLSPFWVTGVPNDTKRSSVNLRLMSKQSLLALDVGERRIGVAVADSSVPIAIAYDTIEVDGSEIEQIARLIALEDIDTVVIGYPRNQREQATAQTTYAEKFAEKLQDIAPEIMFQDESLKPV